MMQLREIEKDKYDVDALLDEVLGREGSPERERNRALAWEEYLAQVKHDAQATRLPKTVAEPAMSDEW
ncbi:MAG: hypothetical protein ACFNUF_03690 [Tannerella sp.]|jgi:hypothetical protein